MDIQDPQTIGVMVFGGFMVISAIGIFLVSTFSMKETSYEEALAKQRKQLERVHLQRSEKKKKEKLTEKKGKAKKREEKLNGKIPERESSFDLPEFVEEEEELDVLEEPAVPERPFVAVATPPSSEKPVSFPKDKLSLAAEKPVSLPKDRISSTTEKPVPSPKDRLSPASDKLVPASKDKASLAQEKLVPAPKDKTPPTVDKTVPSPKDKRKKEKKVAKVEPAPSPIVTVASQAPVTKSAPAVELLAKEVPVIAVPPVGVQQSTAVPTSAPIKKVESVMPVEESKPDVLAKKKTAPKKKTEPNSADSTDGPLYLPYKTLLQTVNSMTFSEGEAQRLIEMLMDKAGIVQDTWHMATQKGDPVAALKRQLEEKERQLSTEQEDAVAARTKLREVTKELVAEKAKVFTVEANMNDKLVARDKELAAVQTRMQASYEDHVNETQQLQAKIQTLKDQLENGPNAQIARLQQENSILRDALNQATSQMESRQNAEMAKLRQDCSRLTKELNEKSELQQQDEEQKRILEEKVAAYETQISKLQTLQNETEETLQRRLDEVSEELRKSQSTYTNLLSGMEKAKAEQQDFNDLQIKLASFEAEAKSKTEELDKLNVKFSEVHSEKTQLEERLQSIETLMESCQSKESDSNLHAEKQAEIEQLQSSLQEKDSLVSSLEQQILQLKETIEQQKVKNNDLREKNWKAVEALTATEAACREKIWAADKAKDEAEQKYSALEKQTRETLQAAFPQIDVASQQVYSEWIHEFKDKAVEALKQQQTTTVESPELALKLREAEAAKSTLQLTLTEAEETKKTLQIKLSEAETIQSTLQQKLTEAEAVQSTLQQKLTETGQDTLQLKLTESEKAHSILQLKMTEAEKAESILQQELVAAAKAQSRLESELAEAEKVQSTLQLRLKEAEESHNTLQQDCDQYRTVLAETEGMLKHLQKSVEEEEHTWKAKLAASEEELHKLQAQIRPLEETMEKMKLELQSTEQLKEHISLLERQLENQLESASSECQNYSKEVAVLKDLLSESQNQLEVATNEVQKQSKELILVRHHLSEMKIQVHDGEVLMTEADVVERVPSEVMSDLQQSKAILVHEDAVRQLIEEELIVAERSATTLEAELEKLRASGELIDSLCDDSLKPKEGESEELTEGTSV